VTWVLWNLIPVHLKTVLVSVQDRCTVCTKHAIGSEIILDAPDELLGDKAHMEAHFGPFGDGANLMQDRCMVRAECTIVLEIVLDTPDRTPR
jgi:hypothetical protein